MSHDESVCSRRARFTCVRFHVVLYHGREANPSLRPAGRATARRPGPSRRARARARGTRRHRNEFGLSHRGGRRTRRTNTNTVQTLDEFEREQTQTQDNTPISKASKPKPTRSRARSPPRARSRHVAVGVGVGTGFRVCYIHQIARPFASAGTDGWRAATPHLSKVRLRVKKTRGAGTPARGIPRFGGVRGARGGEFACALRRGPRGARAAFRAL